MCVKSLRRQVFEAANQRVLEGRATRARRGHREVARVPGGGGVGAQLEVAWYASSK